MDISTLAPRYSPIETPLGPGWMAYTANGVAVIDHAPSEGLFVERVTETLGARPVRKDPPPAFRARVSAAIESGDGSVVDWARISGFQREVLEATARIPRGEVRSYGQVADAIGRPRAMRAVGTALARNPVPLIVPCHRVVRSDGALGSYGLGGSGAKRDLLEREGFVARGRGV